MGPLAGSFHPPQTSPSRRGGLRRMEATC